MTAAAITQSKMRRWRRGQESNLPRHLRGDNGFEDREGHQAPFTLPTDDCGSRIAGCERSTIERRGVEGNLFCLFNRSDDSVEIRPVARVELGMEQFIIGANFESAATRGNESKRLDPLAEFENFGRQTDGLRRVVSNHAVFDRYLSFHLELLSKKRLRKPIELVKNCSGFL